MKSVKISIFLFCASLTVIVSAQKTDPFKPDNNPPAEKSSMTLVWNDEFNAEGKPDPSFWQYETGFVRNLELQWYQKENAKCTGGVLLIEGKRAKVRNTRFISGSRDWRLSREFAEYTSASLQTRGLRQWQFGHFEIRARIDTVHGSWPAIWTLGINKEWPSNGEIDIMEFYRIKDVPTILANFAWGTKKQYTAKWDDLKKPLADFTAIDPDWTKKFHIWTMDWTSDSISIYLDNILLNSVSLRETINPDGSNPFLQPHYLLLNLAIGGNGGTPANDLFPVKYEIDYVRIYQKK
jgi:beta-glucanase (GH16 family)